MAEKVFGPARVADTVARVAGVLVGPRLHDLSPALLDDLRRTAGHGKHSLLFFRDAQEWGWIPRRFDPTRVLATPRSVKALIGPAPRVIADDVWAKLLWAGLHLEPADLVPSARGGYCYPIELVRALAVTWLFSGLRADEITRLRTGCVRWRPSSEAPQDPVCLLDVPGA